jgi:hypothetical protein
MKKENKPLILELLNKLLENFFMKIGLKKCQLFGLTIKNSKIELK